MKGILRLDHNKGISGGLASGVCLGVVPNPGR